MSERDHRTLEHALKGYDENFERALRDAIMATVASTSLVSDAPVMAIRTGETLAALSACMAAVLAACPDTGVPSRLRERVDEIARRLRRDAARARAQGAADRILGSREGGHA